jgi:Tol biopolymer transport system component
MIGQSIGVYEIVARLGAGGMGEVYRARDTKLGRDVALKILPEIFATDADRLARFEREARTLALLNHPNIAQVYDAGTSGTATYLVMELVEGDDLSAHIARGPMSPEETLPIAKQILDALEAAHESGIVHRDLKPANIKVRPDGTVKVLDFGLAKTLDSNASGVTPDAMNSPTLTARATQMGMILGTAAYMSPEQARGRAIDKRTDVWAFGCVLYEVLTGARAFHGEDATEIIASVVKSDPDWAAMPAHVPPHMRDVVKRCLVKDRKARIPDLSVVRYLLDGGLTPAVTSAPAAAPPPRSSRVWQAATALFLLTTLGAVALWSAASGADDAAANARFLIAPPDNHEFTAGSRPGATVPVVSPDGRQIAFTAQDPSGKRLLWVRPVDAVAAQPIVGTDGAAYPFWSPDSRSLGYAVTGKLMKVAATGGPTSTLCTLNPGIISRGGSWSPNGVIIFNNGPAPLYRVSAAGGDASPMGTLPAGQTGRQFPAFLPDGRHFLYSASGTEEQGGVYVDSLDGGAPRRVISASSGAIYDAKSGRLLFVRQGTLLAQSFDVKTFEVSGEPVPVAERVESSTVPGLVAFSVSETGVLAYGTGLADSSAFRLAWVDRSGKPIATAGPDGQYRGVDVVPDGSRIVAHQHEDEGGDLWLTDVGTKRTTRLTFDAACENAAPVWSPEGRRIAYTSTQNGKPGVYVRAADNTGAEERLFETSTARFAVPLDWTHDGTSVLFVMPGPKTASDLWRVAVSGDRTPVPVLQTPLTENHGQYSPDGRWLAYSSTDTSVPEIYVQPASGTTGRWMVSNGGGNAPRWRGDSKEIFYAGGGKIWAVEVEVVGTALVPGTPTPLFDYTGTANLGHQTHFSYAVTKDGQRFLTTTRSTGKEGPSAQNSIVVVLNWRAGLR